MTKLIERSGGSDQNSAKNCRDDCGQKHETLFDYDPPPPHQHHHRNKLKSSQLVVVCSNQKSIDRVRREDLKPPNWGIYWQLPSKRQVPAGQRAQLGPSQWQPPQCSDDNLLG